MLRWANIDGSLHIAGDGNRECCRILGRTCRKCGGFQHGQPVYAGIAEICESCDAVLWNVGELPPHDSAGIIGERDEL